MTFAFISVLAVEQSPQSGCYQHLSPPGYSSCILPPQKDVQDKQVDLTQTYFKLLPLLLLEIVRFHMCPLFIYLYF